MASQEEVPYEIDEDDDIPLITSSKTVSVMVCLGLAIVYFTSTNMGLALKEMTYNIRGPPLFNNDSCYFYEDDWSTLEGHETYFLQPEKNDQGVEFNKTDKFWLVVTSCFGYIFGAGISSLLIWSIGAKLMFGIVVVGSAIAKSLIPPYSDSAKNIIMLNAIASVAEGGILPTAVVLLKNWSTPLNKPILGAVMLSGAIMGYGCNEYVGQNFLRAMRLWKYTIFTFGVFVAPWMFIWLVTCYSDYRSDPFIGEKEKLTIEKAHESYGPDKPSISNIPFRRIIKTREIIHLIIIHLGYSIIFDVVINSSPFYMREILHITTQEIKTMKQVGWVFAYVAILVSGFISYTTNKKGIPTHIKDRVLVSICALGSGILLLLMGFAMCYKPVVYVLYCALNMTLGWAYARIKLYPICINAHYSGFITFLVIIWSTAFENLILYPFIIPLIHNEGTVAEWRVIFFLTSFGFIFTSIPFVYYLTGVPVTFVTNVQ